MYLDRFNLKGRVAVVTGGGQGIGLACVEALSEAGAHVYIADRDLRTAGEAQSAMQAKGYAVDVIAMDVTTSSEVEDAARRVMAEKGRIDILVCNAGIARSDTPAEDVTDAALARRPRRQSQRRLLVLPGLRTTDAGRRARVDRQYRLDVGDHRQQAAAAGLLQRLQGRGASADEVARGRMGRARRAGQRRRADLHQHADDRASPGPTSRCSKPGSTVRRWRGSASRTRSRRSCCSWPPTPRA